MLYLCDRQGLIGREMFAIDGVKLPSNAAKAKSGTRADFEHQADKLEAAAQRMLERHRQNDTLPVEPDLAEKQRQKIERLQQEASQLRNWLAANPKDRQGSKGSLRKSNRTDPESAKMATSKGVIQGYTGVAAVDAQNQIIIEAQLTVRVQSRNCCYRLFAPPNSTPRRQRSTLPMRVTTLKTT